MKKIHVYSTSIEVNLSADKVWELIYNEYGSVVNYADQIVASDYINGYHSAGEGSEQICYFNQKGSTYLKEKMIEVNLDNMEYTNLISEAKGLPMDAEHSQATFKVISKGHGACEIVAMVRYRTKPAFLGWIFKNKFKETMTDYLRAVAYYAKNRTPVTKNNFKKIKKDMLALQN